MIGLLKKHPFARIAGTFDINHTHTALTFTFEGGKTLQPFAGEQYRFLRGPRITVSGSSPWRTEVTFFRTHGANGRATLARLLGSSLVDDFVAEDGRILKHEPQGTFVISRLQVMHLAEGLRLNLQARR
jgi:hypothetical protein